MQPKQNAVELIRKYQQLFTELNHKQIAERLVSLVAARPGHNRVALVVARKETLYTEAIARVDENGKLHAQNIARPLSFTKNLPIHFIEQHFSIEHSHIAESQLLPDDDTYTRAGAVQSVAMVPIDECGQVIASYYIESVLPVAQLSAQ